MLKNRPSSAAVIAALFFQNLSHEAMAVDCARELPFATVGFFRAEVSVVRLLWTDDGATQTEEEVCTQSLSVDAYDVRGREEAAYWCLKPQDVANCSTEMNGDPASVTVAPAIWTRKGKDSPLTELRFHGYAQSDSNPSDYLDIFSRTLFEVLPDSAVILEGAINPGPHSPIKDGYWIRAVFKKSDSCLLRSSSNFR